MFSHQGSLLSNPNIRRVGSRRTQLLLQDRDIILAISSLRGGVSQESRLWRRMPYTLTLKFEDGSTVTGRVLSESTGIYTVWSPKTTLRSMWGGATRSCPTIPSMKPLSRRQRVRRRVGMTKNSIKTATQRFTDGLRGRVRLLMLHDDGYDEINFYINTITIEEFRLPKENEAATAA